MVSFYLLVHFPWHCYSIPSYHQHSRKGRRKSYQSSTSWPPLHFTVQKRVTWTLFGSKRFKKTVGILKKISSLSFGGRVKKTFSVEFANYSICHTFFWNVTIFLSSQTYGWLFLFYIYWFLCIIIHVNSL